MVRLSIEDKRDSPSIHSVSQRTHTIFERICVVVGTVARRQHCRHEARIGNYGRGKDLISIGWVSQ